MRRPEVYQWREQGPLLIEEENSVLRPHAFAQDFQKEAMLAFRDHPLRFVNITVPFQDRPRIGIGAMWVEFFGDEPKPFYFTIREAAKLGFLTGVHRDVGFSTKNRDREFIFLPPTWMKGRKGKFHRKMVERYAETRLRLLQEWGTRVEELNSIKNPIDLATFLIRNRYHKKFFFIRTPERRVAWIGGMNLAREHFNMLDVMVKITNPQIVDKIIEEFDRVGENRRTQSEEIPCAEDTSLLVDALSDKSIIMQKTIEAIRNASRSIYIMSAFHPSGALLVELNEARKRGVHVAYITVHPRVAGLLWGGQSFLTDMVAVARRRKIPLIYPAHVSETTGQLHPDLVHGKVLVVDEVLATVGSHNFVDQPHEELSLASRDPELVRNLTRFLEETIGAENLRRTFNNDTVVEMPHPT